MPQSYREQIVAELQDIPDEYLAKFLEILHYYKLGIQRSKIKDSKYAKSFAGVDSDLTDSQFEELLTLYHQRDKYMKVRDNVEL